MRQSEDGLLTASSACPLCGTITPHSHTKGELIARYRRVVLLAEFEKTLHSWFFRYKDLIPGSYGMEPHLTKKAATGMDTFLWWPIEMLWLSFERGSELAAPPITNDGYIPQMHEALEIKANPFGEWASKLGQLEG